MQFHHLRYIYELAVGGMNDGDLAVSKRRIALRLQVLSAYRNDWPRLHWTSEQRVKIPVASTLGSVTGDFLFFVVGQTLDLMELPSIRLNRPPNQTHHLRFDTNPGPNAVAIDHAQSLIIVGHALVQVSISFMFDLITHPCLRAHSADPGANSASDSRSGTSGISTSTPGLATPTSTAFLRLLNPSRSYPWPFAVIKFPFP